MSNNRDRVTVAPLRSTVFGKMALSGSHPLPARFEAIADVTAGGKRFGALLRHTQTGAYVLWDGVGDVRSLPQHKVKAALAALES